LVAHGRKNSLDLFWRNGLRNTNVVQHALQARKFDRLRGARRSQDNLPLEECGEFLRVTRVAGVSERASSENVSLLFVEEAFADMEASTTAAVLTLRCGIPPARSEVSPTLPWYCRIAAMMGRRELVVKPACVGPCWPTYCWIGGSSSWWFGVVVRLLANSSFQTCFLGCENSEQCFSGDSCASSQ